MAPPSGASRSLASRGSIVGGTRFVMIENADRTITVTREEVFAAAELNEQLAELRIRARALRADPICASTVAEVDWGNLYPRIVIQNHPAPGVTIQPGAIPVDHTLVLAAERPPRPGRQPTIVMRILLVRGSAPACIGEALTPPSPLVGFTALAQEVVAQARQEAFDLRQLNVGPEHILLALLRRPDDVATQALNSLHVPVEHVRAQAVPSVGPVSPLGQHSSALTAPFTPRATGALERARTEASGLGSEWVEPGHILLGLVGDPESSVVGMLRERARDPDQVRAAVTRLLNRAVPDSDDAGC